MKDPERKRLTCNVNEITTSPTEIRQQFLPWLFDVASLLFSFLCVLIVILLLKHYDNKPVPQWGYITFNGVISILAQGTRAALAGPLAEAVSQLKWVWFWNESKPRRVSDFETYEAASRGPRGALDLLCRPRLWHLSTLGAFLIVTSLATEPSLQQLPAYPTRFVLTNETSSINKATKFSNTDENLQGQDQELSSKTLQLSATTKGAFYSGFYNSSGGDAITPSCKTGNCTWAPYTSLGICSACEDVASLFKITVNKEDFDGPGFVWTGPNGMLIDGGVTGMSVVTTSPTMKFQHLQNYSIVDLISLYYTPGPGVMDSSRPFAYECVLYFCVKTYKAAVSDGKFTEQLVSSFPNASASPLAAPDRGRPVFGSNYTSPSATGTYVQPNVTDIHPAGPVYTNVPEANTTIKPPGDEQLYVIDGATLILIREWFQSTMNGTIGRASPVQTITDDISQVLYQSQLYENGPGPLMSRIATALTANVRNIAGDVAAGDTNIAVPYVHVRWEWLALPILILFLALIFTIATIVLSAVKHVPTWRSSSLPSLLYSIDEQTSEEIAVKGPYLENLQKEAEQYVMAMSLNREMWRLEGLIDSGAKVSAAASGVKPFWIPIRRR